MPHKTKADTKEIIELYVGGFSCQEIAEMFDMSRQAGWERLVRKKVPMRKKKILPFIMYDEIKFTASEYGYYRATKRDKHISLHRYKYEKEVGKIPKGYDVHHIDGDRQNNNTDNLECLSKSDHTKKYSPHHNQFKNYETIRNGKWKKSA